MKSFIAVILLLIINNLFAAKPLCSQAVINRVLAPSNGSEDIWLNCSLNLKPTDVVTKRIMLAGDRASGVRINCNGALLDNANDGTPDNDRALVIFSRNVSDVWYPASDIVVENCKIKGSVRVNSIAENRGGKESSLSLSHTERMQELAPKNIIFKNIEMDSNGTNAHFYISTGTTYFSLLNSTLRGRLNGAGVYLDAESGHHTISGNVFETVSTKREIIAIDGSANNKIINNIFYNKMGGVFLYRNCGERGVVRHQTPSDNQIINNIFYNRGVGSSLKGGGGSNPGREKNYAIHVASRNGRPGYCDEDDGYDFGSSKNDRDLAKRNVVAQNQIFNSSVDSKIVNDENPNYYFLNERITSPVERKAGCAVIDNDSYNFISHGETTCLKTSFTCNNSNLVDTGISCS